MAKKTNNNNSNSNKTPVININELNVRPINRVPLDIAKWRAAHKTAEGLAKNRKPLYDIYNDVLVPNGYVSSAIGKRVRAITNTPLIFRNKEGEEVEGMQNIAEKPFMETILREIILTKFWGYSLLELDIAPFKKEGNSKVKLIPREHVKPEFNIVVKNNIDIKGIDYTQPPYSDFTIAIGEDNDLGLLLPVSMFAIYARNGMMNWAEFVENFGIPVKKGLYKDEEGRRVLDEAFKTMGASGSIVAPDGTVVETAFPNSSGNSIVHKEFQQACIDAILIIVLGQTMTTNNGSSLSQAQVHKEVLEGIHIDDRQYVLRILNEKLTNVLYNLGYPVQDGKWAFVDEANLTIKEKIEIAKSVNEVAPVDDDFFYEISGVPKPKDYDKLKKERAAAKSAASFIDNKDNNDNNNLNNSNEKSFLERVSRFFL